MRRNPQEYLLRARRRSGPFGPDSRSIELTKEKRMNQINVRLFLAVALMGFSHSRLALARGGFNPTNCASLEAQIEDGEKAYEDADAAERTAGDKWVQKGRLVDQAELVYYLTPSPENYSIKTSARVELNKAFLDFE